MIRLLARPTTLVARPPAVRMGGRALFAPAIVGSTSLLSSPPARALAVALRGFSTTPALRVPYAAGGLLHPSRPSLADTKPPTERLPTQRLHGTVTAFKHRRGYGFVLAEGVAHPSTPHISPKPPHCKATYVALETHAPTTAAAAASSETISTTTTTTTHASTTGDAEPELPRTYFFRRAHLNHGFFVTEGERVSFNVAPVLVAHQKAAALARRDRGSGGDNDSSAADTFSLGDEAGTESADALHSEMAVDLTYYDIKTGAETPITPIELRGMVVDYDAGDGRGVLAELDTRLKLHDDAPRFPFEVEKADLGFGKDFSVGTYVRFCLEPVEDPVAGVSRLVPNRIIRDSRTNERYGVDNRPLVPAGAAPGSVNALTRFHGTVRDVKPTFGFVVDDLSGESIFFHKSYAPSKIEAGSRVTYLLRELLHGKHKGKKGCFDVRLERQPTGAAAAGNGNPRAGAAPAQPAHPASTSASSTTPGVLDFDLLD